jgi:iron(III) transport system permease protein
MTVIRRRWLAVIPTAAGALVVAVLVVYPLVRLVTTTVISPDGGGILHPFQDAFTSPLAVSAIWGSVLLTAASLLVAVPIALLLAWICSSTDAPMARQLALLPIISLAVSPLVGSIGWLVLLAPRAGILNKLIRSALHLTTDTGPFDAYSIPVIVLVMGLYVVPYVYGPAYAALNQLDDSTQEAARVMGAGRFTVLRTIVFPVLRPAVLAGTLIGGVMAASMFAIPLILASGTGLKVIPTLIYFWVTQEARPGAAIAMASLLSLFTVTGMAFYLRALRQASYVTVGGKGMRRRRIALGPWRLPASSFLLVFICLAVAAPLGALAFLSLVGYWGSNLFAQPLTLNQYRRLLDYPFAVQGLVDSAWLSAVAAVLALAVGLGVAYSGIRRPGRLNGGIAFVASLPLGVPSIVLGLGVLYAFSTWPIVLYGTPLILIAGYCSHVLPISLRNADAALRQIAPELEEAARVSGDTPFGALWRVVTPLLRQPLLTAWGLTFLILFRDLSMSVLLYTPSTIVSSVSLLNIFDEGRVPGAAAYSIVMTLISAGAVWLVFRRGDQVALQSGD